MTTIGKILVFLVFIAALGMGGLMIFISRTTPSWKEAVDDRDNKIKVFKSMLDQEAATRQKLVNENEKMKKLLDNSLEESKKVQEKHQVDVADLTKQVAAATTMQEQQGLRAKEALMEKTRLQQELALMNKVLEEREAANVKLLGEVNVARTEMQAAKNDTTTAVNRLASVMQRLQELERQLADAQKLKSQTGGIALTGAKDASYSNPPQVYVKGRVDRVDDVDKTLVKITIGSDSGIQKNQTLEVFRVSPKAEYLGRIVIVDADLHHAVGRLLRQPGVPTPILQPGDEVASKLRP